MHCTISHSLNDIFLIFKTCFSWNKWASKWVSTCYMVLCSHWKGVLLCSYLLWSINTAIACGRDCWEEAGSTCCGGYILAQAHNLLCMTNGSVQSVALGAFCSTNDLAKSRWHSDSWDVLRYHRLFFTSCKHILFIYSKLLFACFVSWSQSCYLGCMLKLFLHHTLRLKHVIFYLKAFFAQFSSYAECVRSDKTYLSMFLSLAFAPELWGQCSWQVLETYT